MSRTSWQSHAALAIACVALALSIHTAVRARGPGAPCVDQVARDQTDKLRRALAERDPPAAPAAQAAGAPAPAPPSEPGTPHYVRFEIPSSKVSITQRADGIFDIHTTDPSLAGSILQITGIRASGAADKMLIRIPE